MKTRTGKFIVRHIIPLSSRNVSFTLMLWFISIVLLVYGCLMFAHIDLLVSSYMFDPISERFFYHNHPLTVLWHETARYVTIAVILFAIAFLVVRYGDKRKITRIERFPYVDMLRQVKTVSFVFILLVWVLGPGIIINSILKEHMGRARPHQITLFGGDKLFTPAFIISDQCDHNCSFSSGDPASGFALYAFAAIDKRRRRRWLWLSVCTGTLFGMTRIMQGKHFLSDIVVTAFIIYALIRALQHVKIFNNVLSDPHSPL